MATTKEILDHHWAAFTEQDLEAIMEDYVDGSVVITNMGTYTGLSEIEGLFESLFGDLGQTGSTLKLEQEEIDGELAYVVWNGETPDNNYEFCTDTFLIRDDAIVSQTFAGLVEPK
ncbi:nuclear transport factor 2 family protein [Natronorarus salvus]|uniref:nuclear transport factor 2 family protein n=1 Tax=Natronorarus salvus TaxID=3117733 RepID=UPI002F2666CF